MKLAERITEAIEQNELQEFPRPTTESIIDAHLEPVINCLLAYKVHTLRGDHGKAARAVLDALELLDTSGPVTASEGDKRTDVAEEESCPASN